MESWHGTTILGVKKDGRTVIAGDGQVSLGNTVIKPNARKVRRLGADGKVIGGFAGATADAFTLFERLERKLEQHKRESPRSGRAAIMRWRLRGPCPTMKATPRNSPAGPWPSPPKSVSSPTTA